MKIKISLIILILSLNLYSQNKKIIFYNEEYQKIKKSEFLLEKYSGNYLDLYFENDTITTCLLVRRKNKEKLSKPKFDKLKKQLLINDKKDELIVIIYYPGKDKCNGMERKSTWNIFDRDYLKKLKKISEFNHHWIFKDNENLKYYYPKKMEWKKDSNQFIEKTFFKYHYPCFSCVVIDKNGNYISYLGEFGKQIIWELAKELTKK